MWPSHKECVSANPISVSTAHKQTLKAEDIKADNIQSTKRDRVANKQLNDFVVNIKQTTPKAAPKANIIKNSTKEETKAQDKLAFQQVLDFVNSNKKKDEITTKHK